MNIKTRTIFTFITLMFTIGFLILYAARYHQYSRNFAVTGDNPLGYIRYASAISSDNTKDNMAVQDVASPLPGDKIHASNGSAPEATSVPPQPTENQLSPAPSPTPIPVTPTNTSPTGTPVTTPVPSPEVTGPPVIQNNTTSPTPEPVQYGTGSNIQQTTTAISNTQSTSAAAVANNTEIDTMNQAGKQEPARALNELDNKPVAPINTDIYTDTQNSYTQGVRFYKVATNIPQSIKPPMNQIVRTLHGTYYSENYLPEQITRLMYSAALLSISSGLIILVLPDFSKRNKKAFKGYIKERRVVLRGNIWELAY